MFGPLLSKSTMAAPRVKSRVGMGTPRPSRDRNGADERRWRHTRQPLPNGRGPDNPQRQVWRHATVGLVCLAPGLVMGSGCEKRIAVDVYPPGALHVRYVPATNYTDCLVASAVMCANYVTNSDSFQPAGLRHEVTAVGGDPARIADVRDWLAGRRLTMQPLTGSFDSRELTGLGWWLLEGGYPVICVMNRWAGNAEYNHAVVVIGVAGGDSVETAATIHYLDPASPRRLVSVERLTFQHFWNSAGNIMLPVFRTPRELAGAATGA